MDVFGHGDNALMIHMMRKKGSHDTPKIARAVSRAKPSARTVT